MIMRLMNRFNQLPVIMRFGLIVLVLGGFLDLVYHGSPMSWVGTLQIFLGKEAYYAHLMTFAGMVITLIGVLTHGLHRHSVPENKTALPRSRANSN